MDLDLLTIARRGNLGQRITESHTTTIERLHNFKSLLDKITNSSDFTDFEKEQNRIFTIIASVSLFENHMNDILFDILVSFPKKFGKKQFEIDELREEGSLLALFEKKAGQTILDLAYGKFERYFERFSKTIDIQENLEPDKILVINEIKITRDVFIHSNGIANSLYFQKVGDKARVRRDNEKLPLNYEYVSTSIDLIIEFLNDIFNAMPEHYRNSSHRRVFKTMWEQTCLNKRVPFERAWEVIDNENFYIKDRENDFGFSHSEIEVFKMFRDIYSGTKTTDFGYLFKRWSPSSKENQIAQSWLNSPFWL